MFHFIIMEEAGLPASNPKRVNRMHAVMGHGTDMARFNRMNDKCMSLLLVGA
jgi:hypothetical protein